jgi:hypothetical protein
LVCRGAGFWSTHADADPRKECSQNLVAAVLSLGGGAIDVCGETLTAAASTDDAATERIESIDNAFSALEALCVRNDGEQRLQLARQLTVLALNCIASGFGPDCSGSVNLGSLFGSCSAACAANTSIVRACSELTECVNGGGLFVDGECRPPANACEERALPPEVLSGNPIGCSDPGPAASGNECAMARKTRCTILPPSRDACAIH